jgi:hypothetical protein
VTRNGGQGPRHRRLSTSQSRMRLAAWPALRVTCNGGARWWLEDIDAPRSPQRDTIIARKCLFAGDFGDGIETVFGFPAGLEPIGTGAGRRFDQLGAGTCRKIRRL